MNQSVEVLISKFWTTSLTCDKIATDSDNLCDNRIYVASFSAKQQNTRSGVDFHQRQLMFKS